MTTSITLSLADAEHLASRVFQRFGVSESAAKSVARALVCAERDGQKGHGLSRIPSYCEQLRVGKIKTDARPLVRRLKEAAFMVDAGHGFAYPAIDLAIEELVEQTPRSGMGVVTLRRSHHFGQAGAHVERLAENGLVAFLFGNSPKAMAFWGGAKPMMGTNPIAFAAPLKSGPPLVIDLALSVAARGKVMAAARGGEPVPEGWAFDVEGRPTTDPAAALEGSMAPVGGAKGAALALMVEVMAAALTASNFGFEASSFLDGEGGPPDVGCVFLAVDPRVFVGDMFFERMAVLGEAIDDEPGARMPGSSRLERRRITQSDGVKVSGSLYAEIKQLAGLN